MKYSLSKTILLKFSLIIILLETLIVNSAKVKKISFLKEFQEVKSNKMKFMGNYIKHFESITRENILTFKRVKIYEREAFQPYLKEKQDISEQGLKLFRINKKFLISMENIKKSDEYNIIFKYIKNEKDSLALKILHEIKLRKTSPFYYYLHNIPITSENSTPLLYDHSSLDIYKDDDTHQKIIDQVNELKVSYNQLRRLLFSLKDELKNYAGTFSFGDFIWANHVVNFYSIKSWNSYYFLPGAEYLNLNGLMNAENTLVNCCVYYEMKDTGNYYELYAFVTKEEIFEFYDKYPTINKILLNPFLNNEELFIGYGINNIEQSPFDYININIEKVLGITNNSTDPNVNLSCNEHDKKTLNYYLQSVSDSVTGVNHQNFNRNLNQIIDHVSHKIFVIDRIFETFHEMKFPEEVAESYNYMKNRRKFLNELVECLSGMKYNLEETEEIDNHNIIEDSSIQSQKDNFKEDL